MDIMKGFNKRSRLPSWLAAVVLAGFGSTAMAQVIVISPTPLNKDFGTVNVGSTSATTTFTVRNSGTATLNFSGFNFTSGNAISFPVSRTCGNSLRAGSSCTVSFSFKPNLGSPAPGTSISAAFTISSNALSGANTIGLSGKGVTVGLLSINPTSLAFGNVATGSSSGPKTVSLFNNGSGDLSLTSIALTTNTESSYSIVNNNCGATLVKTASCSFGVLFSPGSAGSKPGTVTIISNTGGVAGTTRTVSLTGSGVTPLPVLTLSTTRTVTITCLRPKGGPATATVGVSNTGTGTLNFATPAVSFRTGTSARFTQSNTCTAPLAPGNTCSVAVTFTPTNVTTQTGTLDVISTNAGTKSVGLSGSCSFFTSP